MTCNRKMVKNRRKMAFFWGPAYNKIVKIGEVSSVTKERCDSHIAVGVPGFLKEDAGRAFELPALDTSMMRSWNKLSFAQIMAH